MTERKTKPTQGVADLVQLMTLQREEDRDDRMERRKTEERREEERERQRREELTERAQMREELRIQEKILKEEREKYERAREERRLEEREQAQFAIKAEREERESQRREEREQARQTQLTMTAALTHQHAIQERALEAARTKRVKMGTDIPVLPKLSDPMQLELFLDQFRKDMTNYDVPPKQWTATLRPLLDEKSIAYSRHLSLPIQEDFDLLSRELLRLHGITAEFHGHAWKTRTRGPGEDALQWNVRLGFAVRAWLKDCADREEVMDRLQMERFVSSLDPETERWIRNQQPASSDEAARLADRYGRNAPGPVNTFPPRGLLAHPANTIINNLNPPFAPPTHPAGPTPTFAQQFTQQKPLGGQVQKRPWDKQGAERRAGQRLPEWDDALGGPRCFNCNTYGHMARTCRVRSTYPRVKEEKAGEKTEMALMAVASTTSSSGYHDEITGVIAGVIEGKPAHNMKRDSGASLSFVDRKFLDPDYVRGPPARVVTVQGTSIYPTTEVNLIINGHPLALRMAVSENFIFDALLGTDIPNLTRLIRYPRRQQPRRKCRTKDTPLPGDDSTDDEGWEVVRRRKRTGPPPTNSPPPGAMTDSDIPASEESSEEDLEEDPRIASGPDPPVDREPGSLSPSTEAEESEENSDDPSDPSDTDEETQDPTRPLGRDDLIRAQNSDVSLRAARRTAGLETSRFFHREGILRRTGTMTPEGERRQQTVLPESYRKQALQMAHRTPLAGHFGKTKTMSRLTRLFFWPGISGDVKKMCQTCPVCQVTAPRKTAKAPLIALPIVRTPFLRLAMDMVGPLPTTADGYRYILTICDYGTRYPEAFPLRSTTSRDVVEALVELFSRTGIPEEILTDRGTNFTSALTKEFYTMMGIRSIRTSAYHPQTDAMVEKFNGTLKTGIRKYLEEYGGEWNKALPYILFAYRETPHSSTGFSPFELTLGRTPKGPLDVVHQQWTGTASTAGTDVVSYLTSVYRKMEKAARQATTNEEKAKTSMAQYYDKGARLVHFQIGDLVLLLKPSVGSKLQARWKGPYTIVRRLYPTTYQVKKDRLASKTYTYHVNLLQRYHTPDAVCLMTSEMAGGPQEIPTWEKDPPADQPTINPDLTPTQQEGMANLLKKYSQIFSKKPGKTTGAVLTIETGNAAPISSPPPISSPTPASKWPGMKF